MIERQYGTIVKSIQSDNGGEFKSLEEFLDSLSILYRFTCLYTSKQNGVVESKHMRVVEIGLTLLTHVVIPLDYWPYAFHTFVYLLNRLCTSIHSFHSSYELLYSITFDYTLLKVFGCEYFPYLRLYNQHKL